MRIIVNAQPLDVEPETTLRQLLDRRGLAVDRVAVEVNRRLVRTPDYDRPLAEGDQVEIVTFVGGG